MTPEQTEVFMLTSLVVMSALAAEVHVDVAGFQGAWRVDNFAGAGPASIEMDAGNHTFYLGDDSFQFRVSAEGTVTALGTDAASGGIGTLTLNTVTLELRSDAPTVQTGIDGVVATYTPDSVVLVEDTKFALELPSGSKVPVKVKRDNVLVTGLVAVLPKPALGVIVDRKPLDGDPRPWADVTLTPTDTDGDGIYDHCIDPGTGGQDLVQVYILQCFNDCLARSCDGCLVTIGSPPSCTLSGECLACDDPDDAGPVDFGFPTESLFP